jgi:serine/threonine protein phosphatase PrpC
MGMTTSQLDHLDDIAQEVREGNRDSVGVLSTGEKLYVALAGNSAAILADMGYTIAEAIARVGDDDIRALVERWQYRG